MSVAPEDVNGTDLERVPSLDLPGEADPADVQEQAEELPELDDDAQDDASVGPR